MVTISGSAVFTAFNLTSCQNAFVRCPANVVEPIPQLVWIKPNKSTNIGCHLFWNVIESPKDTHLRPLILFRKIPLKLNQLISYIGSPAPQYRYGGCVPNTV